MTTENTEQSDAIVVPVKVLEKAFGIKERRIRQLAQEGILVKSSRGRYKLIESVLNYITHLKANNEIKNPDVDDEKIDYDEEKAKHEKSKRIKSELELKVIERKLHEACDVEKVMTDMLYNFRARILSMPATLAPILANEHDASKVNKILKTSCLEALYELAEYNPDAFHEKDDHDEST